MPVDADQLHRRRVSRIKPPALKALIGTRAMLQIRDIAIPRNYRKKLRGTQIEMSRRLICINRTRVVRLRRLAKPFRRVHARRMTVTNRPIVRHLIYRACPPIAQSSEPAIIFRPVDAQELPLRDGRYAQH